MKDKQALRAGQPKDANYYLGLARNMSVNIIVVALTPMLLVAGIFAYQFHRSYEEKVQAHLEELILKHQHEIESYLDQHLGLVSLLANVFSLEQLSQEDFLSGLLDELRSEYGQEFADLGLVDDQGNQVAYAGPFRLERALYAGAEWFELARGQQTFISDVFLGLRGLPHFIVAVHKHTPQGEFILRATVDFEAFSRLVEAIRVGETGFAYIINKQGELQTQYSSSFEERVPLAAWSSSGSKQETVSSCTTQDNSGQDYVQVSVPLKNGDWRLVYQQNSQDVYRMLVHTKLLTISVLLLGSILIVTTVLFLSRRMANRVARADKEKEEMDKQVVEAGRLATIGELAAGIAHEINNPVAIMMEEAGWMQDMLEDNEGNIPSKEQNTEFNRALKQIRQQGQRCKEITHKLLHFARRSDSTAKPIQIDTMIEQILDLVEQKARYSKVNVVSQLRGGIPPILGSDSELQQVVLNLMNNAIDAMGRDGGIIMVATGIRKTGQKNEAFIQISDNGQGIPEANLSRIFDPFFTTKPVGQGTGLGLSICYGIVTRMGGDIEVQSSPGDGTVFTVIFPIPDPASLELASTENKESAKETKA